MKKGDLIRIEIKEAREDGLLLYSYKKKADVFVAVSSLKSNYSPKKIFKIGRYSYCFAYSFFKTRFDIE